MKRLLFVCCMFTGLVSASVLAEPRQDLQNRLSKVNSFHANFSQRVTSVDNILLQEGKGELWIKRPDLFNWHMISPDESMLISDGKTLWFYNPFVEQATATWLKDTTNNTPFILITRNNPADWNKYNVKQNGDDFELIPKVVSGNLKQFHINVTPNGIINSFAAIEQDGQRSVYTLKSQQNNLIDISKFNFKPPQGVTLDDQRQ